MSFVPWDQGAMGVFQWSGPNGTWTNRFAYKKDNFTYNDMVALSQNLEANIRTAYKGFLADTVTFYGVDVIDMRSFGAQAYISAYAGAPGLDEGEILPASVCAVCTLRTPGRGRAFRGRTYLAGFSEAFLDGGIWDAGLTAEVLSQMGAWQQAAVSQGWTLCVATKQINKVPLALAQLNAVTSLDVRSAIPGHQRRRDRRP